MNKMSRNLQSLQILNRQLNALSVFRSILETDVVLSLQKLIYAIEKGSADQQISAYGAFSAALYEEGGNLTEFIRRFMQKNENCVLKRALYQKDIAPSMKECLAAELSVLQKLSDLTPSLLQTEISYDGFLPAWETEDADLSEEYLKMLSLLHVKGFGIFAQYKAFKVRNGIPVPVEHADLQPLSTLYGYERERNQVLENTRALAEGKPAANVLLYGDAGTGKSSTIKACAAAFYDSGIRLIEFDKSQLSEIPAVMERLSANPLKFIFYIDDLSFSAGDDGFSALKGILEGGVTGCSQNIAIYATSNRRHLVKESAAARQGDDLHLNDTLQETMSLSARFGLTVTFSKPEKDLYLEIIKSLAAEYGIDMEDDELFRKAEAFAIRSNGRSPRTAKQFIQLAAIGLK